MRPNELINESIVRWQLSMDEGRFAEAAGIVIEAIRQHSARQVDRCSTRDAKFHRDVRVVLNGLRDLANLSLVAAQDMWLEMPRAVERAWSLAQDAQDRLDYSGLNADLKDYCGGIMTAVLRAIQSRFGSGLYTSWEVLFDRAECTICQADIRGCDHVPGRWYGEQVCQMRAIGLRPVAVALVEHPRDPRCRIWPWDRLEDGPGGVRVYEVPIYIIFDPEGPEDGGSVIDIRELFLASPENNGAQGRPSPIMP
jgi:hypothetical protein